MGYNITNNIDKGWFRLLKMRNYNESIDDYLEKYNIDLDDYLLMKSTGNFRFIDIKDINRWANIMCFNKEKFDKQHIQEWLDFHNSFDYRLKYLVRPFPPISVFNKIKIIG